MINFVSKIYAQEDLGIGTITAPPGTEKIQAASGSEIGIVFFISNLIVIATVIAGIWAVFNIVLAGSRYLAAGSDVKAHQEVQQQITNSLLGLLLIVLVFAFGGLFGLLFFGDATFIIEPKIPSGF